MVTLSAVYGDRRSDPTRDGKLATLKRSVVTGLEASRNPVGLPDFKSGGPF